MPNEFTYDNLITVGKQVKEVAAHITDNPMGLATGLSVLDNRIRGLQKGDYVLIAGRPSMGKSSLMADIALNVGKQSMMVVFSLEMSASLFIERLIANLAKVNYHSLKLDKLERRDKESIEWAVSELSNRGSLLVDDSSRLTPALLRVKLEYIQRTHGLDCVVIDYLQLMTATRGESRQQEITDISREIKALAKEFGVPIVVACQLNRAVEYRTDNRPRLSDLRESGSLEQDADKVLLLHRPSYYELKLDFSAEDTGEAEIIIAKNRNGPIGSVQCCWISDYMSFCDVEF
jgi:replicative DNA helicase